jgi:hypothetical protein
MPVQNAGYGIERWPPIMVMHMHVCPKPTKGIFSNLHDRKETTTHRDASFGYGSPSHHILFKK